MNCEEVWNSRQSPYIMILSWVR